MQPGQGGWRRSSRPPCSRSAATGRARAARRGWRGRPRRRTAPAACARTSTIAPSRTISLTRTARFSRVEGARGARLDAAAERGADFGLADGQLPRRCGRSAPCPADRRRRGTFRRPADRLRRAARRCHWRAGIARARPAPWRRDPARHGGEASRPLRPPKAAAGRSAAARPVSVAPRRPPWRRGQAAWPDRGRPRRAATGRRATATAGARCRQPCRRARARSAARRVPRRRPAARTRPPRPPCGQDAPAGPACRIDLPAAVIRPAASIAPRSSKQGTRLRQRRSRRRVEEGQGGRIGNAEGGAVEHQAGEIGLQGFRAA